MKLKKAIVIFLITVLLLSCFNNEAMACEADNLGEPHLHVGDIVTDGMSPFYLYVYSVGATLTLGSNEAKCDTNVLGNSSKVASISAYMYLEREISNGTYVVDESWHQSSTSHTLAILKCKNLTVRGRYRVHGQFYVYNNENRCEIIDTYSEIKTY